MIMQNPNTLSEMCFHFVKIPKKGAKRKIDPKMTLDDLYMTSEVKVDL